MIYVHRCIHLRNSHDSNLPFYSNLSKGGVSRPIGTGGVELACGLEYFGSPHRASEIFAALAHREGQIRAQSALEGLNADDRVGQDDDIQPFLPVCGETQLGTSHLVVCLRLIYPYNAVL